MDINKIIKDSLKEKKILMGTREVIKHSKNGSIKTIILSSHIPASLRKNLEHYSRVSSIELKEFDGDAEKLGQICGKPFKILAVGIRK